VITITPEQLAEMKAQAKLKRMPDGAAIAEASQTPEAKLAAHRAEMEFFAANRPKIAIDHRNGFYPPPEVKTRPTPAPQKVRAKPEVVVDESGESSLE
jgi:hypothetical protein